jgi:hypothetical protein
MKGDVTVERYRWLSAHGLWPDLRRPARQRPRLFDWCHDALWLLGKGDVADRAFARFTSAYADQTEADHQALQRAVKPGRLPAEHGV